MTETKVETRETQLAGAFLQHMQAIQPAIWAALLGVLIVFTVGFAHPKILHDAVHDSRHALAFPCH